MIIHCYGGLSNRLRVLLSYGAAGYTMFRWDEDGEIAFGAFRDVFHSLAGLRFVTGGSLQTFRTCDPLLTAPSNWQESYRLLRFRSECEDWYRHVRPESTYGAIHVRRTDHVAYARALNNETPDAEFYSWLETAPKRVYLATDNAKTQMQYWDKIRESGRTPFVSAQILEHLRQDEGGVRTTSLATAAIDLFACAGASSFKGTRESSFSDTIDMLHKLGGWWS